MKYQRLVSSTTPSSLQEWLGQELDDRGIDSVYARSILSLLQQDYVDIEPYECQHLGSRQQRVLHKYGGPENLFSATKSKHQKWKTWGKQILLSSTSSCCKVASSDLELLKKRAAVDCLRSASDYICINDIEELIDEVWIKLKNIKNLNREKEDRALRNVNKLKIMDPFFIPASSPTDKIEKYFAAFPPLTSKTKVETGVDQHKIIKNAWCEKCVMKKKPDIQNEASIKSDTLTLRIPGKCSQPIIPYSSLKTIKNVYKKQDTVCEINQQKKGVISAKLKLNACKDSNFKKIYHFLKMKPAQEISEAKKNIAFKIISWKAVQSASIRSLILPLENLSLITINQTVIKKIDLIGGLQHISFQTFAANLYNILVNTSLKFNAKLNTNLHSAPFKSILSKTIKNELNLPTVYPTFENDVNSMTSSFLLAPEITCNDEKESNSMNIDIHFKMSPLFDYSQEPNIEMPGGLFSTLEHSYADPLVYYFDKNANPFKTFLDLVKENENTQFPYSDNEVYCSIIGKKFSCNKVNDADQNVSLHDQGYDTLYASEQNSMHEWTERFLALPCIDVESNKEINITEYLNEISHLSKGNNFSESLLPKNVEVSLSDEEIFYSDDDSNEIFLSDEEENLFTSSKTHFQSINPGCLSESSFNSELYVESGGNILLSNESKHKSYIKTDSDAKLVLEDGKISVKYKNIEGQKLLKKVLFINKVIPNALTTKTNSLSSSCEELSDLIPFKIKKANDSIAVHEQKYGPENFENSINKETNCEIVAKHPSAFSENSCNKNFTSSDDLSRAEFPMENGLEIRDIKWLFHWGDNDKFITHTWQRDNFVCIEKQQKNKKSDESENIAALCKEIKEEGDELLKELHCLSNSNYDFSMAFEPQKCVSDENYLHSNYIDLYFETSDFINSTQDDISVLGQEIPNSPILIHINSENSTCVMDTSFTLDNINNSISENTISHNYHAYNTPYDNNFCRTENVLNLNSVQGTNENIGSYRRGGYMEGGGWSLASDSFLDCDETIYERASSLGDLNLENSEGDYIEFYQQRRFRCTSETDEEGIKQIGNKRGRNIPYQQSKQKYPLRKRPCCNFLQGTCTRSYCKFSHDLSTTTCRFWKEGSCFKGETCPFLHGYIKESDYEIFKDNRCLQDEDLSNSYSLESEADFPSLSSVKSEGSKIKSASVNIIPVKGLKKKMKREN